MKKLLLAAALSVFCLTVSAQEKAIWGVRAGVTISNLNLSSPDGKDVTFDSRSTFHIGFAYQQPFSKTLPLYLETGLYFTGRGCRNIYGKDADNCYYELEDVKTYYFQIPLLLSWHFNIRDKVSLQPAVGAYYAIGVSGEATGEITSGCCVSGGSDVFGKYRGCRRSDMGLRFSLGIEVKRHVYFGLGYDLGLMNMFPKESRREYFNGKLRNGAFFLSVGGNF